MSRNSPRRKRRKKLQLFSNGPPCSKSNSLFQFILEIGEFRLFGWKKCQSRWSHPSEVAFIFTPSLSPPSFCSFGAHCLFFWGGEAGFIEAEGGQKRSRQNFRNCATFFGFFYYYSHTKNFGGKGGKYFYFYVQKFVKVHKREPWRRKKGPNSNSGDPFSCILSSKPSGGGGERNMSINQSDPFPPQKMGNEIKTNSLFPSLWHLIFFGHFSSSLSAQYCRFQPKCSYNIYERGMKLFLTFAKPEVWGGKPFWAYIFSQIGGIGFL